MDKKREYKFFKDDAEQTPIEVIEDRSFKRAVKSIQSKVRDKKVIIEYVTKRGKQLREYVFLPIGRVKKIGKEMYDR
jgi:hypothetical protein